jgi:hypothetical protein
MHLVRQFNGLIFIDEHDLVRGIFTRRSVAYDPVVLQNVKNLCSGFSYCISILQTLYVWYGRGSVLQERQAALAYAQTLAGRDASVIELTEGENDDDEMFWMILGDDDYAKADYWQWRQSAADVHPRIWRVDIDNDKAAVSCQIYPDEFSILIEAPFEDSYCLVAVAG